MKSEVCWLLQKYKETVCVCQSVSQHLDLNNCWKVSNKTELQLHYARDYAYYVPGIRNYVP